MILNPYRNLYKFCYEATLKEILEEKELNDILSLDMEEMIQVLSNNELILSTYIPDYNENKEIYNELNSLLINRYAFELMLSIDYYKESNLENLKNEFIKEWCYSFIARLRSTYKRYMLLLKLYEDSKNKLLLPITSESSLDSRFNDTPQDEGSFDDVQHNTNVSQSKGLQKNERDTIIERIDDISKKYRNLLHDWSDEFRGIFIERR